MAPRALASTLLARELRANSYLVRSLVARPTVAPGEGIAEDARMPMYLVRWPDLSAALVTAANENDLMDILDQVADPTGCMWTRYRGPVFLEFRLNAELNVERSDDGGDHPLQRGELQIGDVSALCQHDTLTAAIPTADAADDMKEAITRFAFPALHAALEASEENVSEADVRAAVDKDIDLLLQASWQQQQTKRRRDDVSQVAAAMGTSPQVIEHLRNHVASASARTVPPQTRTSGRRKKPPGAGWKQPRRPSRK